MWCASPPLADAAQRLGRVCRLECDVLDRRRVEMVILRTAVHHGSETEWAIHEPEALAAGLEREIVEAIREGRRPPKVDDDLVDAALFDLVDETLRTSGSRVSDETHDALADLVGDRGVVEAVGIVGYYTLVAYTLNVFEVPP